MNLEPLQGTICDGTVSSRPFSSGLNSGENVSGGLDKKSTRAMCRKQRLI